MRVKGRIVVGMGVLGLALLAGGCASIRDHRGYLIDATLVDSIQPQADCLVSTET
jgi:hypothetical protein